VLAWETGDAELLKVGETSFYVAIPSQARSEVQPGRCRD